VNDAELQAWIERISLESFGIPFRHRARFNPRLRSTGGRYFLKSHDIEINPHQLEAHGKDEVEKIIKHELCHYHLHIQKRGYQHRDVEFKALLAQVGGSRFCSHLPTAVKPKRRVEPYRYELRCERCGMSYKRKRRMDPRKYACGKCRGRLELFLIQMT